MTKYPHRFTSAPPPHVINAYGRAAANGDDIAVLWYLDRYPAFADAVDEGGRTSLMQAVQNRQVKIIDMLLSHGINPALQDTRGWTALMMAAWRGDAGIVDRLVAVKSPVDTQSHEGLTALMLAANMGRAPTVKILLDAGANTDLRDLSGRTADEMAFDRGYHDAVSLIRLARECRAVEVKKRAAASQQRHNRLREKRPDTPFNKKGPK